MYRVESLLSAWKKLYLELADAQLRLNAARSQSLIEDAVEILKAEVVRLQSESDAALDALHVEMARFKTTAKAQPTGREGRSHLN